MQKNIFAALAVLGLMSCPVALAADPAAAKTAATEVAQGVGAVKRVDVAADLVNIAHDPIPSLTWPAMTMDFKVTDKKLLKDIKPGQVVSFGLVKDPKAGYLVSRIGPAK